MSKKSVILLLATILCLGTVIFLSLNSYRYNTSPKATVTATVVETEYYDNSTADSEGGDTGYHVYVDYTYEGKAYEHIFYQDVSNSSKFAEGTSLEVKIYTEHPDEIARDTFLNVWFFVVGLVVLAGFTGKTIYDERKAKVTESADASAAQPQDLSQE